VEYRAQDRSKHAFRHHPGGGSGVRRVRSRASDTGLLECSRAFLATDSQRIANDTPN
jgi:hypothetical protein